MAFLLDTLLTIPIFGVIAWITTRVGVALNDRTWLVGELGTVPDSILYYGTPVLVFAIVLALLEASKWQGTLGKILMKIQVTDIAGNRISFARALKRNVFRVFFGNLWIILLVFFFHEMFKKFEYDLRELVDDPMIYFLLWVPLLIIQIVYYLISGKLIHDRFSGTVVGERL
jgi:uncharacterized RDD family membrane protein YckC